jgi:hypothetical protein
MRSYDLKVASGEIIGEIILPFLLCPPMHLIQRIPKLENFVQNTWNREKTLPVFISMGIF